KKHPSALLVAHLEQPNLSPRALMGAFSGTTEAIKLVLTGPSKPGKRIYYDTSDMFMGRHQDYRVS
ncbi:MAG: hypothetical protein KZQ98_07470, partial [Candidatus Thiodiazotropha sp. (ex Lucinoma borealis)]|nr:hypothetical protein [Candidatus Thiodiazotropha sp. (ex Lucinoma borealis)]